MLKRTNLTEGKTEVVINTVLESSKHLNRSALKRQKYNLINEIKKHYGLEDFFKTKLPNYKAQAAIYTLIEGYNCGKNVSHEQSINNKLFLLIVTVSIILYAIRIYFFQFSEPGKVISNSEQNIIYNYEKYGIVGLIGMVGIIIFILTRLL